MPVDGFTVVLESIGVMLVWWLGIAGSPLHAWGWALSGYHALATSVACLLIADWNSRRVQPGRRRREQTLLASFLMVLALLAVLFTLGRENTTTVTTLILAALALGLWAVRQEEVWASYLAGLFWLAGGLTAGLVPGRSWGWTALEPRLISAAVGEVGAIFVLAAVTGWMRLLISVRERCKPALASSAKRSALVLLLALERVAFGGSLLAAALVARGTSHVPPIAWLMPASVVTLLSLSLFYLSLTRRWQTEWLVYLAQACLVGAYVEYRLPAPASAAVDAAVILLFAFADLGMAEIMERFQFRLFIRPTRYAALVLPVLPLLRLVEAGGLNDATTFQLLAAGTFYAVACGTLQWKSLGYAAGVLYNAALWVLWGQMGWQLADHTQFYFVPVGLSAISFAEANRRDLGRVTVNTIRSAGLITNYLALAAPIWQFRSFGDWVALLLGSLLGVFAGIGLRLQTFVWLGLVTFLADVLYELGRLSLDHALAKWAIMLSLGILLVFFVALNEKRQIVAALRGCFDEVCSWE